MNDCQDNITIVNAEGNRDRDEGHNEIFGTWIVAKKNPRNKNSQTNQERGTQRRKPTQNENTRGGLTYS